MASISWLFGIGGDWSTAVDWSGGIAPGSADDVTIDASGTYTVMIGTTAEAANSLTLDAAGATLAITEALTVGTTLDAAAGTLKSRERRIAQRGHGDCRRRGDGFRRWHAERADLGGRADLGATGAALDRGERRHPDGRRRQRAWHGEPDGDKRQPDGVGHSRRGGRDQPHRDQRQPDDSGTVTDAGALTLGAGNSFVESSGTVTIGAASTDAGDLEVQNGGVAGVTGDFTNTGTFGLHDSGLVTIAAISRTAIR